MAPTPPPAQTWTGSFGVLVGSARVSIDVAPSDGTCTLDQIYSDPDIFVCDEHRACEPYVVIHLILDDDILLGTANWTIVSSGTVCNKGHDAGRLSAIGSTIITVFGDDVSLGCGGQCTIASSYAVNLTEDPLVGFDFDWGTASFSVGGGMNCTPCGLAEEPDEPDE
jgi:hypothetical protein